MLALKLCHARFGTFGALAGCNTIEGAGRDIEQGGKAIKDENGKVQKPPGWQPPDFEPFTDPTPRG